MIRCGSEDVREDGFMPVLSKKQILKAVYLGARNLLCGYPLATSFEVTHSCNADCRHCDKGGPRDETILSPQAIAARCRELHPVVAQISGGEPLLRSDIVEIANELRNTGSYAVLVLVTNASLLTEDKYLEFKKAGVDEFSISIDYPDSRHDEQRKIPGLFRHLTELVPAITSYNNDDVSTVTVIRKNNLSELPAIANLVISWGAKANFTAYTPLRTGSDEELPKTHSEKAQLRESIETLISIGRETGRLVSTEPVLHRMARFLLEGNTPQCRAGQRCLVVNPDGGLTACAMFSETRFQTRRQLLDRFVANNTCQGCYISMRANTEKPFRELLFGSISALRRQAQTRSRPG
jgi:MoaA/NifB/PqqE/SkfB family radical SAM enzyme